MKIDATFINKEKQKAITHGLEGQFVLVHFDPHAKGVKVPEFLLDRPSVTLKLSYFFKKILHVTPEKVTAELLFGDVYHTCLIPYEAIWGVAREGEGLMMWPASVPPEVAQILGATAAAATKGEPPIALVESGEDKVEKPKKKRVSKKKTAAAPEVELKEVKEPTKEVKEKRAAEPALALKEVKDELPPPTAPKTRERPKLVRVK
jgi:stringent starvation protein B